MEDHIILYHTNTQVEGGIKIKIKQGKSGIGNNLFSQITSLCSSAMAIENSPDLQTVAFRNMVTQNDTPVHQTVALRDTEAGQSETSRVVGGPLDQSYHLSGFLRR